jgi:hypothetical protein
MHICKKRRKLALLLGNWPCKLGTLMFDSGSRLQLAYKLILHGTTEDRLLRTWNSATGPLFTN